MNASLKTSDHDAETVVLELDVKESMLTHGTVCSLPDLFQTGDLVEVPYVMALHVAKQQGRTAESIRFCTRTQYWTGAVVEEAYIVPSLEHFGYDLTDPMEYRLWNARQHRHAFATRTHDRAVLIYVIEWDEGCRIVVPEAGLDRMGRRLDQLLGEVRLLLDVMAGIDFEDVDIIERTPFLVLDRDQLVVDLLAESHELLDYASGAVQYNALQASRLMDSMFRHDGLLTA